MRNSSFMSCHCVKCVAKSKSQPVATKTWQNTPRRRTESCVLYKQVHNSDNTFTANYKEESQPGPVSIRAMTVGRVLMKEVCTIKQLSLFLTAS